MKSKRLAIAVPIMGAAVIALFTSLFYFQPKDVLQEAKENVKEMTKSATLRDGDLIFQTSLSGQCEAVQRATKSVYSHCGIIYKNKDGFSVFEAVQPVKHTPLEHWIARGKGGHYVIKRLNNANEVLTPDALLKMRHEGEQMDGKNYDLTFEWNDDQIYCSELIWKIYQRATGIEIGPLQHLRDFDLTDDVVKKKMKERYGDSIPLDELVISPGAIFDSPLLFTVEQN